MGCSLPGFSVHGIFQAKVLELVAISFSRGFSQPTDGTWASLVAKLVKNLPVMQETRVQSLGWEDLPEKEMATHSSICAWRIP